MLRAEATVETLDRIAHLDPGGRPVLSVYLDLAAEHFGLPAERHEQLSGLLADARHQAATESLRVERDIERVRDEIAADPGLLRGARGLAVFSSAGADILEIVGLAQTVSPQVAVNSVPWLEPMAETMVDEDVGVFVVSRSSARVLRGGATGLTLVTELHTDVHGRHAQGGSSQTRYARGVEQEVAWHVGRACAALEEANAARRFSEVVLVAASPLRPVVEGFLKSALRRLVVATVDADVEDATVEAIERLVAAPLEDVAARREHEILEQLDERLGTGRGAAAGAAEVLAALNEERVGTLLLSAGTRLSGTCCPACGRLANDALTTCPLDGSALLAVDAGEHAIARALQQSADVAIVRHHADALVRHGSIAALLRW